MTDNDYTAAFEEQTAAADAFDNAEGYYFQNKPLEPFSGRRRRIAEKLGLRFFDVVGGGDAAALEQFSETKSYKGFEDDIVLVLWLCSVSKERVARARKFPDRAFDDADDWADEHGIYPGGHGHAEACQVFTSIVFDILNAVMQAAGGNLEADGDAPGKPHQTGHSTSSHLPTQPESQLTSQDGTSPLPADTSTSPDTSSDKE